MCQSEPLTPDIRRQGMQAEPVPRDTTLENLI